MKCPACGAEGEGRFCGFCGVSLEARSCPACGNSVPTVHRFCSECGAPQGEGPGRPSSGGSTESGSVSTIPGAPPAGEAPPVSSGAAAPPASTSAVGSGDASLETGSVAADGSAADGSAFGGDPSRAAPSPVRPDRRKWWISGAALLGAIVFLTLPYVWTSWADGGNGERMPMGAAQRALPAPGPAPGVDLSSMTPREAADRLFNRVMGALSSGDQGEVDSFLPMAIDAYRLVPDLDADGHFHLSLLHQADGNYQAGLETAERVLATEPDHLLALYAAGESARAMGDVERAATHFRRVLDVFDAESARDLPEYREHASLLPALRESAEEFLGR